MAPIGVRNGNVDPLKRIVMVRQCSVCALYEGEVWTENLLMERFAFREFDRTLLALSVCSLAIACCIQVHPSSPGFSRSGYKRCS